MFHLKINSHTLDFSLVPLGLFLNLFGTFLLGLGLCYLIDRLMKSSTSRSYIPSSILVLSALHLSGNHGLGLTGQVGLAFGVSVAWIIGFHWLGQIPATQPLHAYLLEPLWNFSVSESPENSVSE